MLYNSTHSTLYFHDTFRCDNYRLITVIRRFRDLLLKNYSQCWRRRRWRRRSQQQIIITWLDHMSAKLPFHIPAQRRRPVSAHISGEQRVLDNDGRRKRAKQQLSKFYWKIRLGVLFARPYDLLTSSGSPKKTICSQPLCCCLQFLCRTSSSLSVAYRVVEADFTTWTLIHRRWTVPSSLAFVERETPNRECASRQSPQSRVGS